MMSTPQTFAFHVGKDIMVNGVNIFKHVSQSVVQWGAHQYEPFGEEVGAALALLFIGQPSVAGSLLTSKDVIRNDWDFYEAINGIEPKDYGNRFMHIHEEPIMNTEDSLKFMFSMSNYDHIEGIKL